MYDEIKRQALSLDGCKGLQLTGLTHKDSPQAHIKVSNCDNSVISNLHINAPGDSPNTDGIDISSSTQVQIHDSVIATGIQLYILNFDHLYDNIFEVTLDYKVLTICNLLNHYR